MPERRITARNPARLRSSCSGSEVKLLVSTVYAQEGDNVLGHLRGGRGSAVLVLDQAVKEHTGHSNLSTREEGVEVQALLDTDTRRRVAVTGKERKDVVRTAVTGLDDQSKVRRDGTCLLYTSPSPRD